MTDKNTDQTATVRQKAPADTQGTMGKLEPWMNVRLEELQRWYQSACAGRQEAFTQLALLQAHADKLAEALERALNSVKALDENYDENSTYIAGTDALAAYESEAAQ